MMLQVEINSIAEWYVVAVPVYVDGFVCQTAKPFTHLSWMVTSPDGLFVPDAWHVWHFEEDHSILNKPMCGQYCPQHFGL